MDREVLQTILDLLESHRVLSLAVIVDGEAEASLLPYALRADHRAVYVQASSLARHARGLQTGAQVGLLVHANDTPDMDPLQIPRLSVQAAVTMLSRDGSEFASASATFIARFPGAEMTLGLGDFNLFELELGRGRFVAGFARAFNVGPNTFSDLSTL